LAPAAPDFQPPVEEDTELRRLLQIVNTGLEAGDFAQVLRHVDKARRFAPESADIAHLHGRLLLKLGENRAALGILQDAAKRRNDPDIEAAIVEACLALDAFDLARNRLDGALHKFAVTPDCLLATAARQAIGKPALAIPGWFGVTPTLGLHGDIIGRGGTIRLELSASSGETLGALVIEARADAPTAFSLPAFQPSPQTPVRVSVDGVPLLGSGLRYKPDFDLDGRATLEGGKVTGWVALGWLPRGEIDLVVEGRGPAWLARKKFRLSTSPDRTCFGRRRFSFHQTQAGPLANTILISAILPDGETEPLPDAPLLVNPALEAADRPRRRRPAFWRPFWNRLPFPHKRKADKVAVVIPVYKGYEETLACLNSVLDTAGEAADIIVIDDATPDSALAAALDGIAARGAVILLRNERNLGFPASVNRGLTLHPDRDVVILNADTIVFRNWIERLRAAAYSAPGIGTVTPLSNAGSIASYPAGEGSECSDAEASALDERISVLNAGTTIEVPTGVGFCLFVRRQCLDKTGLLDERCFEKGYGEENDFCMRASKAGWRHVLAADVFVRHAGGLSFGKRRDALMERNRRILNLKHPGYDSRVQEFLALDPIHPVRRRLDEDFLAGESRPVVLLPTLALPGGVDRFVRHRLEQLRRDGVRPVLLRPLSAARKGCTLSLPEGEREHKDLYYDTPAELAALGEFLTRLKIHHVELHHFLGLDAAVVDLVLGLGAPCDIYIHDYSWYCPRLSLLGGTGRYCGEPELAACEACIDAHGSSLDETLSVSELRSRSARWLETARSVIAPCQDVGNRFRTRFPGIDLRIEPWETLSIDGTLRMPPTEGAVRIAVIGAIGAQKGYPILLDCARDAAARSLPLEFVVIGFTEDDDALSRTGKIFITGRYEEDEIGDLIRRENPHIAFFPSVTPETWCYTLSHALRAGLLIAAFDHGAIAERLRALRRPCALFPLEQNPARLNDDLLRIVRDMQRLRLPADPGQDPGQVARIGGDRRQALPPGSTAWNGPAAVFDVLPVTASSRTPMPLTAKGLTASVEVLTLTKGLYLFRVRSTVPTRIGEEAELTLPAIHVGSGPGSPDDEIEIMTGPRTKGTWLCEPRDMLVLKVAKGPATILLTSLRTAGLSPLDVEVQRLDNLSVTPPLGLPIPEPFRREAAPSSAPPALPVIPTRSPISGAPANGQGANGQGANGQGVPLKIVAHIQNRGDVPFVDAAWAGFVGEHLWIESFAITPLGLIAPDEIEYKGLTATGVETPWVGGGASCGTRGVGVPLIGFSVRLKPKGGVARFDCEYTGAFLSGKILGPFRNGAPCRSSAPDDALEGIRLTLVERADSAERPSASEPADFETPEGEAKARPPIGPRFSIFREAAEP
jgi:GT2 family glycosyltransferase/glycosyltransferase involved in cell wall biosynthesis